LFDAPVGAAIGRPSGKIRSNVKQRASAKTTITNITGRAGAKNDTFRSKCESAVRRAPDEQCSPLRAQDFILFCLLKTKYKDHLRRIQKELRKNDNCQCRRSGHRKTDLRKP
ncbi:MAG: hypothetical protein ACI3VK_03560, partial [Oscillospiraceae bacterium]